MLVSHIHSELAWLQDHEFKFSLLDLHVQLGAGDLTRQLLHLESGNDHYISHGG